MFTHRILNFYYSICFTFRNEMRQAEKDRRNATKLQWQQVALVLDRFLFILFATGTTLTSLTIIYQRQLWNFFGYNE